MIPVELTPQVDSIPATGHSEAVCADATDTKLGAARTIAKAIAFDTRMKGPLSLFPTVNGSHFPGRRVDLDQEGLGPKRSRGLTDGYPLHPYELAAYRW